MKVMRFNDSSDTPALVADMVPTPQPDRGEMLIRVYAAGVTRCLQRINQGTARPRESGPLHRKISQETLNREP